MPHVVGGNKVLNTFCSNSSDIELPDFYLLDSPENNNYNTVYSNSSDIELPNSYGLLDDDELSDEKEK